jgi:threonyl-tRNA synthetase
MIHAAVFGSFERFIGIITEHFAGEFPIWLSPVQAVVLPISEEKFGAYAKEVQEKLVSAGIRAELDDSKESLGKRISEAEKQKIPYMLVVGEKEMSADSVAVRSRGDKKQEVMKVDEFAEKIKKEIDNKS